tara:strand:+ start:2375 stop:3187 length:813 start_codon:yes stop_codon:yes gene_type:complete
MQYFRDLVVRIKLRKIKSILSKSSFSSDTTHIASSQWLEPVLLGKETLKQIILNPENIRDTLKLLEEMPKDEYLEFLIDFYKKGLSMFGDDWVYADIVTALNAISKNIKIKNYLEIGVRKGRSMIIVSNNSPEANFYGFDLWLKDYIGIENPGADYVESVLKNFNHRGKIKFIDGDSKKTIPLFFKKNPDLFFDLITVDGDHRINGARTDIRNVVKKLKVGGILVFDDISSPHHPYLKKLWKKEIENNPRYLSYEYEDIGLGVGIAVKKY